MAFSGFPTSQHIQSEQKPQINLIQFTKSESILPEDNQSKFAFKKIVLPAETLNSELKIYQWRQSIETGIVQCYWTCILPIDKKNVLIQLKNKFYPFRLKKIAKVNLSQLLYMLRQTLVGFKILYNKFGGFQIDNQCIFIDEKFQIEVWGSKEPSSNNFCFKQQNQHQFLCSLLRIFQNHAIKSNLREKFNQGLLRYESLTFDILKRYIDIFIVENQLMIGSQKSIKEMFMYPKSLEQIKLNHQKNLQKNRFFHFIQSFDKEIGVLSNDQNENNQYLDFSSKKKIQKRHHIVSPSNATPLKDSDMTTEETQSLSRSRQVQFFKSEKSNLSPFDDPWNKNFINRFSKSHHHMSHESLEKDDKQKNLIDESIEADIEYDQLQAKKFNHDSKKLLSSKEESQTTKYERMNPERKSSYGSQEEHYNQPELDLTAFKQKLESNFQFFYSIDSLAETKQMTNSIQIGEEKWRKSPLKLQKLSKIKSILYESIIEEDFFHTESSPIN